MARSVVVTLVDDFDGTDGPDVRSRTFALDGVEYTLDLGDSSHEALSTALSPFIAVATKSKKSKKSAARVTDAAAIRSWAAENGVEIKSRGRIPEEIVEQFKASK